MGSVRNRGTKDDPKWYMRYNDLNGPRELLTKARSKALALDCLREAEARVARGQLGVPERPTKAQLDERNATFDELAARFLVEYERKKIKDLYTYRIHAQGAFRRMSPLIGRERVAELTRERIEWAQNMLTSKGYAATTVKGTLAFLCKLFTWAVEKKIIGESPMKGYEYPDAPPAEDFFSADETLRMMHPAALHPMVAFALLTGARKGEILGLTWPCVSFTAGRIEIKRSYDSSPKSGKARTIPMHRELAPILRAWQKVCPAAQHPGPVKPAFEWTGGKGEALVFPVSGLLIDGHRTVPGWRMGNQNDLAHLVEFLESLSCHIPAKPWHAMRHTFISRLAESGASPIAIERIVGHAPSGNRITAGYTHLSLEFLARELDKLDMMPPEGSPPPALRAHRAPELLPPPEEGTLLSTEEAAQRLGITPTALHRRARLDPELRRHVVPIQQRNRHGQTWRWRWPLPTPVGRQVAGPRRLEDPRATMARALLTAPRPEGPDLLSYREAADVLGLAYNSFKEIIRRHPELGDLAAGQGRGNLRFRAADLLRWVESGVWQPKSPDRMAQIRARLALESVEATPALPAPPVTSPLLLAAPAELAEPARLSYREAAALIGVSYGAFKVRVHSDPNLAAMADGEKRFDRADLERYMSARRQRRAGAPAPATT